MKMNRSPLARILPFTALCLAIPGLALAASITLTWQANTEADLSGYNVYVGEKSRIYGLPVPTGTGTSYKMDGLVEGKTYYFAVSALDTTGNESGLSSEVSKAIPLPSTGVTVNKISVASGRAYTPANELGNGDTCYIDRSFTYSGVPGAIGNATYILTANADKKNTRTQFLSFDVDRNVTIYVAHDDRLRTKPSWLKAFTDTGMNLKTDAQMSLYAREFPAGRVILGGNNGVNRSSMYTVVVVPR